MSDYVQEDYSGSIFKNDRKTNDRQPTHKGSCTIDGQEYWISAWTNEVKSGPKKGNRYFSLRFEIKDVPQSAPASSGLDGFDDDIPF